MGAPETTHRDYPLRCSACGTTGDAITVAATTTGTVEPDELSIVERLHREERHTVLQTRAARLIADIEEVGASTVPDGLAPSYIALETLTAELAADELVAITEVEAIEEYLTTKAEVVYSRETVTKITDLEQRVEDLTADVEQLEAEKARLKQYLTYGRSLTDEA